jgi:hypothetical protein
VKDIREFHRRNQSNKSAEKLILNVQLPELDNEVTETHF